MFAAPLFVILALWGCKGESTPQAPVPTAGGTPAAASGASTGNHPPAVRSARIFPSKAMIEMELRVEVQGEDYAKARGYEREARFLARQREAGPGARRDRAAIQDRRAEERRPDHGGSDAQ